MGDWRVPALPNKRCEPTPRARMLTPEVIERGSQHATQARGGPTGGVRAGVSRRAGGALSRLKLPAQEG